MIPTLRYDVTVKAGKAVAVLEGLGQRIIMGPRNHWDLWLEAQRKWAQYAKIIGMIPRHTPEDVMEGQA